MADPETPEEKRRSRPSNLCRAVEKLLGESIETVTTRLSREAMTETQMAAWISDQIGIRVPLVTLRKWMRERGVRRLLVYPADADADCSRQSG